ncbi:MULTISPECIES: TPM domain-containing protein [Flavobacterium]|uniref:TPM domain-containing protein n=1 Tax=Flavobacterium TaxID=237 RepID=UPI001184435D|nr:MULTISPECIES: TPM domain-containing protein [Flavobacterium]MCR4033381.1 TPM domain-containing protein [Flavobacterium panacis]
MKNSSNNTSNSNRIFQFTLLFFTFLICNITFAQFDIPPKPSFQTSVYDYANVLSSTEKAQLEEKLIRYSDSTTTQIVVITIESLKGEDVSQLATKWGQTWGIGGTKEDDNGVIILLAKNEKKIAINPGYGLEDRLTAGIGGTIIRNIIVPEFKAGSFYNGLDKGTDAIIDVFKGKFKGERKTNKGQDFPIFPFIVIVVIILILLSRNKRGGGNSGNNGGGGPSLLDVIILSNLGRSGGSGGFGGFGGGSSGGGGGFGGGFGGGGFSGGGSSGGW